jgi:hypothetical protein
MSNPQKKDTKKKKSPPKRNKRKHPADLYLYSAGHKRGDRVDKKSKTDLSVYPADVPGDIIGTIDRKVAHDDGEWHGNSWVMIFQDGSIDDLLVQNRNKEALRGELSGTRWTLSAAGHQDTKIKLSRNGRTEVLPYKDIPHKVAYAECGAEIFFEELFPDELVLVELLYVRNDERRNRSTGQRNREHNRLYVGVYGAEENFRFDERETDIDNPYNWEKLDKLYEIATFKASSRNQFMRPVLALALQRLQRYEREIGGRKALRDDINSRLLVEYKRIQEYQQEKFAAEQRRRSKKFQRGLESK